MLLEDTYSIVRDSEITFESELSKPYVSNETRAKIENCSILMLPLENFRKQASLSYNEGFRNLYFYLRDNLPQNTIDFCIDKEKIEIISLHSSEFYLGKFLLDKILLPVFVNLISDYLKNKLFAKDDDIASIDVIVADKKNENKSKEIKIKGTPSELIDTLKDNLTIYTKDGKLKNISEENHKIDVLS